MAADKKISELAAALSVVGTDISVLVHDGVSYQFDFSLLTALLQASITAGATFTFGTAIPANGFGLNGDVFFKTDTTQFYQKTSGTWSVQYTFDLIADGTVIYGTGAPLNTLGHDQYTYIDTNSGIFYLKTTGVWAQVFSMAQGPQGPQGTPGTNGTNGTNGKTIYNGTSNPSNTLGTDGDFYLNTSTMGFFGPKTSGVWGTATDLRGPAGVGVPAGGTTGQALKKIDGTDFNTLWAFIAFSEISGNATDNTSLTTALNAKVDKVTGKQLSDENYTTAEKSKLAALSDHYRGYYASLAALQAAIPTGNAGDYATVDTGTGSDAVNYIWDTNDNTWVKSGGAGSVTSVNSKVGAVVLSTDDVGEGSTNKYFTAARVLATVLAGIVFTSTGLVTNADSILIAFGKLQAQISALFFAGGPLTGFSSTAGGTVSSADTIIGGMQKHEWILNNSLASLQPTTVKIGTYNAVIGDYIPFDTSGGNGIVNLPSAPGNRSVIGVKQIIQSGSNTVTINCTGSDVLNRTGGSTSFTLSLLSQGAILLYNSGIWYVIADDFSLSSLDARYSGSALSKAACNLATTTINMSVTYNNGTAGVGATLTGGGLGALVVDGVTVTTGMRILVKSQNTNPFQNGIYVVTNPGSALVAYVLTRATDFDQSSEISAGSSTFVLAGSTQASTMWDVNSNSAPVMGTDPITFAQTGGGTYVIGNGLAQSGSTLSIDTAITVDKTTAQSLSNKTTPNVTAGDNSTKLANTAYVDAAVATQAKKSIIGSFQSSF